MAVAVARRVFFSFHYERDAQRAHVVRNSWVVASQVRWKIGDGRRLLVMMLGGGCDGFGDGDGGLGAGVGVEQLTA